MLHRTHSSLTETCSQLPIAGIVPFSTVDYPERLSAVVFTQGCPWRCGYCHNPHLRTSGGGLSAGWGNLARLLDSRMGLLDAVVFSGGEPTAHPVLTAACAEVRDRGFAVGLHTGGAYPAHLAKVLPLVNWVGIDVKAPFAEYDTTTRITGSGEAALESLRMVIAAAASYEVRTTVHSALLDPASLKMLSRELEMLGVSRWVLQPFRALGASAGLGVSSYSPDDLLYLTDAFGGERQLRAG